MSSATSSWTIPGHRPLSGIVHCDQALFTSARSSTSDGYQLVAASSSIRPEEKAEITKWSPSHGALVSEADDAVGLLAYRLSTGRHAVAVVRPAGPEPTGRGGQRIFTHTVLLEPDQYARCGCNAVRVHAALRKVASDAPPTDLDGWLGPITLPAGKEATLPPILSSATAVDRFMALVKMMMSEQSWISQGAPHPYMMLDWALSCVPPAHRAATSISIGLKTTSSRPATLILLDAHDQAAVRRMPGHCVQRWEATGQAVAASRGFEPWFTLVRRWVIAGRFRDLDALTLRLTDQADPVHLTRLAALCRDMDALETADQETCNRLRENYISFSPTTPLERDLLERIIHRCGTA
jgi:hypothetical protein